MAKEPKSGITRSLPDVDEEREREANADRTTLVTCRCCAGTGLVPPDEMARWKRDP